MSRDFAVFILIFDTELQNVLFSYLAKASILGEKKSVVVQCLNGVISSADALGGARAASHMTRAENASHQHEGHNVLICNQAHRFTQKNI